MRALLIGGEPEADAGWCPFLRPAAVIDDDPRLVRRIASGDRIALGELYDRYAGLLLAVARRILGGGRDPEDLVHDVFLEVWKRAGGYEESRASVRTWLLVRLRSRALDRAKSAHETRTVSRAPERFLSTPAEELTALPADPQALVAALGALSKEQRRVIELAYFEGLSGAGIALREAIPLGTVKSRLSAAISRLRAELGVTLDTDDEGRPR